MGRLCLTSAFSLALGQCLGALSISKLQTGWLAHDSRKFTPTQALSEAERWNQTKTRSSWLNCALRDDEAVYWVSIGHYEAVAVGNWWYWVSRGHSCLYILQKVEIWKGVTHAWLTHSLTTLKDSATQLLIKYKSGALVTQLQTCLNNKQIHRYCCLKSFQQ